MSSEPPSPGGRDLTTGAPATLSGTIERLIADGVTVHFGVVGNTLRALETGKTFVAHEVVIEAYERFEGVSDPGDMSIVYTIQSSGGTRGFLVDAFGVYSSPAVSTFLAQVPIHRASGPVRVPTNV